MPFPTPYVRSLWRRFLITPIPISWQAKSQEEARKRDKERAAKDRPKEIYPSNTPGLALEI